MTKKTSIEEINIDFIKVHPLVKDFNNPKKKDHIEYTMERYGQFIPLIGNKVGDTFYIINGIVRFEIAKALGFKSLQILDSDISDEDVLAVRLTCNQQTKMSYSEMAQYGEHMLGLLGK
jgi:ParB-like chromosome segregation protein Spo0J